MIVLFVLFLLDYFSTTQQWYSWACIVPQRQLLVFFIVSKVSISKTSLLKWIYALVLICKLNSLSLMTGNYKCNEFVVWNIRNYVTDLRTKYSFGPVKVGSVSPSLRFYVTDKFEVTLLLSSRFIRICWTGETDN